MSKAGDGSRLFSLLAIELKLLVDDAKRAIRVLKKKWEDDNERWKEDWHG